MNVQRKMGPQASIFLALAVLIGMASSFAAAQPPEHAPGQDRVEVLIGFHDVPGPPEHALVEAHGGMVRRSFWIVPTVAASIPERAVEALSKHPRVSIIEPNGFFHLLDVTMEETSYDWGVGRIGAPAAHELGIRGAGVTVAIVDSGVDYEHPDLMHSFVPDGPGGLGYNFVDNTEDPMDDQGHGTHVAGTVAADGGMVGVAPDVQLFALRVLGPQGGSYDDVIAALEWCVTNKIHVANHSYGSSGDPGTQVKKAFDNSAEAGVLHVGAAGNSGNPPGRGDNVIYPARWGSVIAVAATGENDKRARFSSTGPDLELSAPGVGIRSTMLGGGDGTMSGTSMASPHVAGVAALLLGEWCPNDRQVMIDTAEDLGDHWHYGYGLVDVMAALEDCELTDPTDPEDPEEQVIVTVTTDKAVYSLDDDTTAELTVKVEDENDEPIGDLGEEAFFIYLNDEPIGDLVEEDLVFAESPSGTYMIGISISDLDEGKYDVLVDVVDGRGVGGGETASFEIVDEVPEPTELSVTVEADEDSYRHRDDAIITVTVTAGEEGVDGAFVDLVITTPNRAHGYTGTTSGEGEIVFSHRVNTGRDGTGRYSVDATATKAGYDDGHEETSFDVY